MARTSKKTIYEKIEDQQNRIKETEELLTVLNEELQDLYKEQDNLEMIQLLNTMKTNGLTIDKAMKLLNQSPK